jgi:hypothetical protein
VKLRDRHKPRVKLDRVEEPQPAHRRSERIEPPSLRDVEEPVEVMQDGQRLKRLCEHAEVVGLGFHRGFEALRETTPVHPGPLSH